MKYKYTIILLVTFFQQLFSQEITTTSVLATDVIGIFSSADEVTWSVPVASNENLSLKWSERSSEFTKKQGIRTFVGYQGETFVATLAISGGKISGNILWKEKETKLQTDDKGYLVLLPLQKSGGGCGTCKDGSCTMHHGQMAGRPSSALPAEGEQIKTQVIITDGVLRVYRLAMFISNEYYKQKFGSDVARVKTFWANAQTFLNEIYMRDVGVRFEIVDDERLIAKTSSEDPFINRSSYVTNSGTLEMNKKLGKEKYDLGIYIMDSGSRESGLARISGAYLEGYKAGAYANSEFNVIGHEIGHLFGSNHTFTTGGSGTYYTEPDTGQSIMSYGSGARDFFSLVSVKDIRYGLSKTQYYTDKQRTNLIEGSGDASNFPYGVKQNNTPPVINRTKLKESYTIPKDTYFQFEIDATDKEQKELWYIAHQADINKKWHAKFNPAKATNYNVISYQNEVVQGIPRPFPENISGEYTFWIGVSDAKPEDNKHGLYYDTFETKVNVLSSSTPFKITSSVARKYKAGDKVNLEWTVDSKLFPTGSKVRILMSDDGGDTFKHVLNPETENDGQCEVTLPNIELGRKALYYYNGIATLHMGKGVLKVEVIDDIVYAISKNGINEGFEIERSKITFQNTPEATVNVQTQAEAESVAKAEVTAVTTCNTGNPVTVQYAEDKTKNPIVRTWTATDNCNNTATFTQYIYYKSTNKSATPLRLVNLPSDVYLNCNNAVLPQKADVKVEGGCNPKIYFTETKHGEYDCYRYVVRKWTASDDCNNSVSHTQFITIGDKEAPVFQGQLPQDITIYEGDQIPYQQSLTAIDNCRTNVPISQESYEDTENGKTVRKTYTWRAEDNCYNVAQHKQTITIVPRGTQILKFTKTPDNLSVSCGNIPSPDYKQFTTSGCENVTFTHQDVRKGGTCANSYSIERTYTASGCGQNISHKQMITVSDTEKPVFENVPQNKTIVEGEAVPEQITLTARDNCSGNVSVEKLSQQQTTENGQTVIMYGWKATDACGNIAEVSQKITVLPRKSEGGSGISEGGNPPTSEGNTFSEEEIIVYNGVSAESDSSNYFRIEPIDKFKNIHLQIFDDLGKKVFESKDYQRKGDIFRGYANVKGVVGKGKRLPSGTYFYIMDYQDLSGKMLVKKGYLFVR